MSKQNLAQAPSLTVESMNDLIIDAIQDIKGKNIQKLDLRKLEDAPTDFFIICEGESTTQVKSIADNVKKKMREEAGQLALHTEGTKTSTWVLVDFFETILHVFHPESRKFYELEELWSDAVFTEYQNL